MQSGGGGPSQRKEEEEVPVTMDKVSTSVWTVTERRNSTLVKYNNKKYKKRVLYLFSSKGEQKRAVGAALVRLGLPHETNMQVHSAQSLALISLSAPSARARARHPLRKAHKYSSMMMMMMMSKGHQQQTSVVTTGPRSKDRVSEFKKSRQI